MYKSFMYSELKLSAQFMAGIDGELYRCCMFCELLRLFKSLETPRSFSFAQTKFFSIVCTNSEWFYT